MVMRRAWRRIPNNPQGRRVRPQVEALEDRVVPTNWFVSTLGVDDPARGGQGAPLHTIQYAINQAASGDRIHVAEGTYGYNPAADQLTGLLHINPAALLIYDKSLQIFGGFDNAFTSWAPSTRHTIIDGGSAVRGVYVLGNQADVSLDMEGFTVEACLGQGERNLDPNAGNDRIFGFGGGMWINDTARNGSATPGAFVLRDVTFYGNRAVGFDTTQLAAPEPGQVAGVGGAGAGAALALRYVANLTLDRVTFANNEADGGAGSVRGGDAVGGAIHSDHSHITGTNLVFNNDRAIAGNSTGAGTSMEPGGSSGGLQRRTADGLAGAAAIQIESSATLQNVVAVGNGAVGGNAGGQAGSGEAGAFLIEDSDVTLTDATIRGNLARGGNGQDGGLAGGGGIATDGVNLTLTRVAVLGNVAQGGGGTRNSGSPGGGGLYLVAIKPGDRNSATVTNSVIAGNTAFFGGGGEQFAVGGGGGGVWLQGVAATFTHVTFAANQLGPNLYFGQALLLINDGLNNGPAPTLTTATVAYSIIADHTNNHVPSSPTVHVRNQGSRNILTYQDVLDANNTADDNSNAPPGPEQGVYHGLDTVRHAADAGFVAPAAPNYNYALQANSPAVGAAVGSTTLTDIEQHPRAGTPDLGAYEAPPDAPARSTVAAYDPGSGLWQLRSSNAGGPANLGVFAFGLGLGFSTPVVGDWDGNGTATVGVVEAVTNPSNPSGPHLLKWNLKNSNTPGGPDIAPFFFGQEGDIPVVGDWDGNGTTTVGIVRPTGNVLVWYLRNSNSPGAPDISPFAFGQLGDMPVVGKWDGAGGSKPGVFRPSNASWFLATPTGTLSFAYGAPSYKPVVGDWNSDGRTTVGVMDPGTATWYLRNENTAGGPDAGRFVYAEGSAIPLAGNFDDL